MSWLSSSATFIDGVRRGWGGGSRVCLCVSLTASARMSCQGQSALQMGEEGHKTKRLEELTSWK